MSDLHDDNFLSRLASDHPASEILVVGDSGARIVACFEQGRCRLFYEGEAVPEQKSEILSRAKDAGITNFDGVLIDFTRFTGVINWEYVKRQENIVPNFPVPSKVAYLVRDIAAAIFVKAIMSFSKHSECRAFTSLYDAECWLGWK